MVVLSYKIKGDSPLPFSPHNSSNMVRFLLYLKFRKKDPEMKQSAVVCFKNNSCRLNQPLEPFPTCLCFVL